MIHNKLQAIQQTLKVGKSRKNVHVGYMYRSAEDILNAVKPLLNTLHLTLTLSDDIMEVGNQVYVQATATLFDLEDNSVQTTTAFAREDFAAKGMSASQTTGAASSYARKYALNGMFLLDDVKDADTDEYHTINNAPQPQQTVQSTQEPLTREQKISKICAEVLMCNSTEELSTLWKKLKRWTDEEQIKNTFSQRKNELLNNC